MSNCIEIHISSKMEKIELNLKVDILTLNTSQYELHLGICVNAKFGIYISASNYPNTNQILIIALISLTLKVSFPLMQCMRPRYHRYFTECQRQCTHVKRLKDVLFCGIFITSIFNVYFQQPCRVHSCNMCLIQQVYKLPAL